MPSEETIQAHSYLKGLNYHVDHLRWLREYLKTYFPYEPHTDDICEELNYLIDDINRYYNLKLKSQLKELERKDLEEEEC